MIWYAKNYGISGSGFTRIFGSKFGASVECIVPNQMKEPKLFDYRKMNNLMRLAMKLNQLRPNKWQFRTYLEPNVNAVVTALRWNINEN